jgi:hypothetical protein
MEFLPQRDGHALTQFLNLFFSHLPHLDNFLSLSFVDILELL